MDDFRLFGKSEDLIDSLVQTVFIFSEYLYLVKFAIYILLSLMEFIYLTKK